MNVEIFALCDAATNDRGKLNILGTFDTIWARQVPTVHPLCTVAMRLRFSRIEQGEHKIRVQLVDEDGGLVMSMLDTSVQFLVTPPMPSGTANFVINLQNMQLDRYGEYSIALAVDGRHQMALPLFIKQPG